MNKERIRKLSMHCKSKCKTYTISTSVDTCLNFDDHQLATYRAAGGPWGTSTPDVAIGGRDASRGGRDASRAPERESSGAGAPRVHSSLRIGQCTTETPVVSGRQALLLTMVDGD